MYAIYRGEGFEILIPFECKQCGKCCEELSQCVYLPNEKRVIAESELGLFEYLDIEVETKNPILIKPCPFLKNNRCSIHPIRPESCREFPLGKNFDCGIDCPALKEIRIVVREITETLGEVEFVGNDKL